MKMHANIFLPLLLLPFSSTISQVIDQKQAYQLHLATSVRTLTELNEDGPLPKYIATTFYDSLGFALYTVTMDLVENDTETVEYYEYNTLGNMTGWKTVSYYYNPPTSYTMLFVYDKHGNLLRNKSDKYRKYHYNLWGREKKYILKTDYSPQEVTKYRYNFRGNLIMRTHRQLNSADVTRYYYDNDKLIRVVEVYDNSEFHQYYFYSDAGLPLRFESTQTRSSTNSFHNFKMEWEYYYRKTN